METPARLEIQGFEPSAHVRGLIETNLKKIEERYGRTTSCRVAIQGPGAHHREGEPFAVSIRLSLPNGREVNVGRVSKGLDRRQADVNFAINDAFRRAVRQLRDQTRKLQGVVKQSETAPTGTIVRIEPEKSFGILLSEDRREIYFHANSVLGNHFRHLLPGDRVAYHEEMGEKGPQASTVRVLRPSAGRH